jgi:hypothetical protein
MRNKRSNYRQGVVKTKEHFILTEGQYIDIISEEGEDYWVMAPFDNAPTLRIAKKDVETN